MSDRAQDTATTFHPLTRADAAELLPLWNRSSPYDQLNARLLDEKIWQDPDHDTGEALVCRSSGQLTGFVVAVPRRAMPPAAPRGHIALLAVDPDYRRHGLGSRLLSAAERALARGGASSVCIGESAPNYLTPGVDLRYQPALAFLASRGYQPTTQACNMRASLSNRSFDTTTAHSRLERMGITVRRASGQDRAALEHLVKGFGGRWIDEVSRSMEHDPPLVHIAGRNDALLGFCASEGNNIGTGWFGPMGTAREARGLGIGQVLLNRSLADLAKLGFTSAIIPWVGPVDFYARYVGAVIDRRFQRFEKELHT